MREVKIHMIPISHHWSGFCDTQHPVSYFYLSILLLVLNHVEKSNTQISCHYVFNLNVYIALRGSLVSLSLTSWLPSLKRNLITFPLDWLKKRSSLLWGTLACWPRWDVLKDLTVTCRNKFLPLIWYWWSMQQYPWGNQGFHHQISTKSSLQWIQS